MAIDLESGSSQWLDIGLDDAALNGAAGSTLMAWINLESAGSGTPGVVNIAIGPPPGTSSNTRAGLHQRAADSKLGCQSRDTDGSSLVTNTSTGAAISNGIWTHVAAIFDIPGDATRLYINGVQDAAFVRSFAASAYSATNSKNGAVGAEDNGSSNFLDGQMADVRVYNRVLSAVEIMGICTARGGDANFFGLQHRWNLNELGPGNTVTAPRDTAYLARTLTPVASPVYSAHPIRCRRMGYL